MHLRKYLCLISYLDNIKTSIYCYQILKSNIIVRNSLEKTNWQLFSEHILQFSCMSIDIVQYYALKPHHDNNTTYEMKLEILRLCYCYRQQQNKWYPFKCLLAHFEATLYFSSIEFSCT